MNVTKTYVIKTVDDKAGSVVLCLVTGSGWSNSQFQILDYI